MRDRVSLLLSPLCTAVLIQAGRFDTTWVPRFPIVANGINLQDFYKKSTDSYFGVAVPQSKSNRSYPIESV
jgi:hypothetical protein